MTLSIDSKIFAEMAVQRVREDNADFWEKLLDSHKELLLNQQLQNMTNLMTKPQLQHKYPELDMREAHKYGLQLILK